MKKAKLYIVLIVTLWLCFVFSSVTLIVQVTGNSSVSPGTQGAQGAQGEQGAAGERGTIWHSGKGAPTSSNPADAKSGDFYIDLDTMNVYIYNGTSWAHSGTLKGDDGEEGKNGNDGNTWLYGETVPSSEEGKDGDFYFYKLPERTDSFIIYCKENGEWKPIVETGAKVVSSVDDFIKALDAGSNAVLNGSLDLSEHYAMKSGQSTVIDGNGNTLSMTGGTDSTSDKAHNRIINVESVNDVSLTVKNIKIDAPKNERGISAYTTKNVTISVQNSEIIGEKYPLNIANGNENIKLNVSDSRIQGYCAFQSYSADAVINVDNSTLYGLNQWGTNEPNNFAVIVVMPNAANNKITIKNTRIEAKEASEAREYFASIRSTGLELTFENCTFVKNGQELKSYEDIIQGFQIYNEAMSTLKLTINGTEWKAA